MSAKHLAKGSAQPPKVTGKLRLYSMEFCPFAQRARLVLLVKNVPHDVVNVHLKNKPDWIFELHPEGKVPALDTGAQVVIESLDISDFLDEQYPEPPLYPADPHKKEQDKRLVRDFGALIGLYYKTTHNVAKSALSEHLGEILPHLKKLEGELEKRGTYFGGDQPGMVDYMIWPWGERAHIIESIYNAKIPSETDFPRLYKWCKAMRTQKAVQQTEVSKERHYKIHLQYQQGPEAVDYDSI